MKENNPILYCRFEEKEGSTAGQILVSHKVYLLGIVANQSSEGILLL